MVKTVKLDKKLYVFHEVLKARKRGSHYFRFIMSIEKYGWAIQTGLLA